MIVGYGYTDYGGHGGTEIWAADGAQLIAFSTELGLDTADTNGTYDIYLQDRTADTLTRVSVPESGGQYDSAVAPELSPDGQWLAFDARLDGEDLVVLRQLVPPHARFEFPGRRGWSHTSLDALGEKLVYTAVGGGSIVMFDRTTNSHQTVSVGSLPDQGGECAGGVLSGNGRFVAFSCSQPMTSHGATDQAYVRDLHEGRTRLASIDDLGVPASHPAFATAISYDGSAVVINTLAFNLHSGGAAEQIVQIPSQYWDEGSICPNDDTIDPRSQAALTVSAFELVGVEQQVSGTIDYTYAATMLNSRGVSVPAARAIVTTVDPDASIPDAELAFGFIAAGESARSVGTFTVRQDEDSCFKPASLSFALTTPPAFEPPVPRGVELGSSEVIQLAASDPEGDPLSFSAGTLPAGVTLNAATGALTVVATGVPRSFSIRVTVSDGVFEDSTSMDIALYAPGVLSPPALPPDLTIPPDVQASLPQTTDGRLVLSVSTESGNPDAPTIALVYDSTADGPMARWGACLSRVLACARTNSIGTFPDCVPMIERCVDDTGGMDCCAPSCIDAFVALANGGVPVMEAINDSFLDGQCQEGLR